jgi:hypothetical protein
MLSGADQSNNKDDIVSLIREKKRYSFVMGYQMGIDFIPCENRAGLELIDLND